MILPAGRVPATAELSIYLKAAYALEQPGLSQPALSAYRAGTTTWPSTFLAWLALGNMAYQLQLVDESIAAFMHAAGIEPEDTVVWNNLAYALHDYGCNDAARRNIGCARRLEPDDRNIRDSESDIQSADALPTVSSTAPALSRACPVVDC